MMKDKIKKILIPFVLMIIINLGTYHLTNGGIYGVGLTPHVGILLIAGLLFGPYGAIGSVAGNILCDLIRGYSPENALLSAIIGFGVSYLAYKLWYETYNGRLETTKPKFNNTSNVLLFLGIINLCGILYALLHGKLFYLLFPDTIPINNLIEIRYFLNFINSSFIFGIIGIMLFNKINFIHTPKPSKKELNKRLYKILGIVLILTVILSLIIDCYFVLNNCIVIIELATVTLILYVYLTKPITSNVVIKNSKSILEEIMNIFIFTILFIIIIGIFISYDHTLITAVEKLLQFDMNEIAISMMILMDIILLIFFIPSLAVLRHMENQVIKPIISFSKIENFIHENEKIKAEGLIEIYSEFINEETEIGTLARSYTDLIKFNNNYIENIQEIEGEKERIKAELNIATKIQAANLPTKAIENDYYTVNGYSHPAKEVGGDFFDYYELDNDNLAIVIGDASGKGVPAALLSTITQAIIKQLLQHETDPSKVLYLLNNQLCENNPETMFITLWLGIYNKTTKTITFSNAGHNPPLIKENEEFKYLNIDTGIVLGVMEDFDFVKEELSFSQQLVIYTDGITDANNKENEMYGEDRLLKFFNNFKLDKDPIRPLLSDINNFTDGAEQFDDMTLLYLKIQ